MNVKDIVKNNNIANFSRYQSQNLYYAVEVDFVTYEFPVPISDIGDTAFASYYKAITLMRYIRQALDSGDFLPIGKSKLDTLNHLASKINTLTMPLGKISSSLSELEKYLESGKARIP